MMPKMPGGLGLQMQHLEAVFYRGAPLYAEAHELRGERVVHEVVEQVAGINQMVGQRGTSVGVGVHARRRAVDDDFVCLHHLGRKVGVGESAWCGCAAHAGSGEAELPQPVDYGLRGAAGAQH